MDDSPRQPRQSQRREQFDNGAPDQMDRLDALLRTLTALAPAGGVRGGALPGKAAAGSPDDGGWHAPDVEHPEVGPAEDRGHGEDQRSEDEGSDWFAVIAGGFLAVLWDFRGHALWDLVRAILASLCGKRCESFIWLVRAVWACLVTLWWIMLALVAVALWRAFAWPLLKKFYRGLE